MTTLPLSERYRPSSAVRAITSPHLYQVMLTLIALLTLSACGRTAPPHMVESPTASPAVQPPARPTTATATLSQPTSVATAPPIVVPPTALPTLEPSATAAPQPATAVVVDGSDARWIAYTAGHDNTQHIFRMHTDGSQVTRLTEATTANCDPVWSPDGQRIAFFGQEGGNWDIYVMDADGSNLTRLTTNPGDDMSPA
jgi:hypothetical protein